MSACRSLIKYLFYFFNHEASDNKQEGSLVATQVKPTTEQHKSWPDFVRELVKERSRCNDMMAEVKAFNAHTREIKKLGAFLNAEKKPEVRDKINKEIHELLKLRHSFSDVGYGGEIGLLLSIETNTDIRKEIIERIQYDRECDVIDRVHLSSWLRPEVLRALILGGRFLLEDEVSQELLRSILGRCSH
jgi:hypothetical protein